MYSADFRGQKRVRIWGNFFFSFLFWLSDISKVDDWSVDTIFFQNKEAALFSFEKQRPIQEYSLISIVSLVISKKSKFRENENIRDIIQAEAVLIL
ncbi:hypothetical protein B9Z55_019822 [Caenorhabditis nigoni]|uniref:Uncharacterized protein n=1 Tax=Caenorhabditis nigoni TaxID=1611254 RepID=A0A2G5TK37_9PELO|nr:hypothetical protein B9Z55_019822 [Caenorhabditis nigoni]